MYDNSKKLKILLVDDEQSILNSEIRVLRKWQKEHNIEILTASSGNTALEIIRKEIDNLALIVSDEKMPGLQGSELLIQIHKDYPDLLSIILTGYSSFDSVLEAIKAGVHSYLIKPIENELFVNEIEKVLALYKLKEENKQYNQRISNELKWASELQKKLLHVHLPSNDKIRFDLIYQPVKEMGCGGDFYDILTLSTDKYLFFIGDVAGHGIKAALITTIIKQIIRGELMNELDLENSTTDMILTALNRLFYQNFSDENNIMVTFSVQLINCETNTLTFSNGGHLPFFRLRNNKATKIGNPEIALGFTEEIQYKEDSVNIESGDKFLFLTDGLIEVPGRSIFDQIDSLASALPDFNEKNFLIDIKNYYRQKFRDNQFLDDITLVSVEII